MDYAEKDARSTVIPGEDMKLSIFDYLVSSLNIIESACLGALIEPGQERGALSLLERVRKLTPRRFFDERIDLSRRVESLARRGQSPAPAPSGP